MSLRSLSLSLILTLAWSVPGIAAQCDGENVVVIAPNSELVARVCAVVERARARLESCELRQSRPLVIRVSDSPDQFELMGHFGTKKNEIGLLSPSDLATVLKSNSAYREIETERLFDSIVVHELAHAIFTNTPCGMETCLAGHEYISFALQFWSLEAHDREALPSSSVVGMEWFTDERLTETPEVFAANAWLHFSQPGFGCGFIRAIVAGDAVFPSEHE